MIKIERPERPMTANKVMKKGVWNRETKRYELLHLEYCPRGHQNNLLLNGVERPDNSIVSMVSGKCPVEECPYNVV